MQFDSDLETDGVFGLLSVISLISERSRALKFVKMEQRGVSKRLRHSHECFALPSSSACLRTAYWEEGPGTADTRQSRCQAYAQFNDHACSPSLTPKSCVVRLLTCNEFQC